MNPADHPTDPYARLREDLEKAVRRVCPPWLSDKAQDLVQVSMIRLLERERRDAEAGEGKAPWSASYLYRVAHSVLVDEIRARRRRPEVALDDQDPSAENRSEDSNPALASSAPDPQDRTRAAEIGRALRECLGRLVDDRRRAVSLNLAGHSVPETARLLGFAPKRAENLVYRGLADLRGCLGRKGWAP
jgi:RNA polymerase sigma-70 factor (ECF subfamily)